MHQIQQRSRSWQWGRFRATPNAIFLHFFFCEIEVSLRSCVFFRPHPPQVPPAFSAARNIFFKMNTDLSIESRAFFLRWRAAPAETLLRRGCQTITVESTRKNTGTDCIYIAATPASAVGATAAAAAASAASADTNDHMSRTYIEFHAPDCFHP